MLHAFRAKIGPVQKCMSFANFIALLMQVNKMKVKKVENTWGQSWVLPVHLNGVYSQCLCIKMAKIELLNTTNVLSFFGRGMIKVSGLDIYFRVVFVNISPCLMSFFSTYVQLGSKNIQTIN